MQIGVIISTYNNPQWLEKTFWGYMSQLRKADEIIVADDGSGKETRKLIEKYSEYLPLRHVWHPDKGFRKTKILNKALSVAESEYLIFTDQDCVPRNDFVLTHERLSRKGRFLSGGYFKLPMALSQLITHEDIADGNAFRLPWLRKNGLSLNFKCSKLVGGNLFPRLMNLITPTHATWNGMNSSGWRDNLIEIDGFDERMQYGGEDRELGERLINYGIRPCQIRYSAIVLHLDHNRPYVNDSAWKLNNEIRRQTRLNRLTRTDYGISSSLHSEE